MTEQEFPLFAIEKIYVKDLSLEVPNAPAIYLETAVPEVNIQLQTGVQALGDDAFEVVVTAVITATIGEKSVFLIEVGQGGVFRLKNIPEADLNPMLMIACPNILFPYVREVVSDAAVRAGFSPVILQPVNFEALYVAHQEGQNKAATEDASPATIQ